MLDCVDKNCIVFYTCTSTFTSYQPSRVCSIQGCFRHLSKIFKQLEEFRPFELLRSSRDRIHYLLVKEAKVIAMTCTHAALKRKDLVELAFKVSKMMECSIWLYSKQNISLQYYKSA